MPALRAKCRSNYEKTFGKGKCCLMPIESNADGRFFDLNKLIAEYEEFI